MSLIQNGLFDLLNQLNYHLPRPSSEPFVSLILQQPEAISRSAFTGAIALSNADAAPKAQRTPEALFDKAQLLLDEVVRNALRPWKRHQQADDVDRFKQRLELLLWQGDLKLLREFRQEAKLKTWLQKIANHEVSRVLREESRNVSFDDAPPEKFIQPPTQEKLLLQKEWAQLLEEALPKLTEHERKLVELMRQDLSAKEIARELGIMVGTVYLEISVVKKKLRELIEGRQK